MQIVVLDGELVNPGDLSWDDFKEFGEVRVYRDDDRAATAQRIGAAEVAILNRVPLDAATLRACPNLKYVGLLSTGYNVVDVAAAAELGIVVSNAPGYSTIGVSQHTMALLLELCHRVGQHNAAVQAGEWAKRDWCFWQTPLVELQGKTMGIVGFGNIGRATGRLAAAFGMRVLAAGSRPTAEGRAIAQYVPLAQLLAAADVIALHCPLNDATRGMIDAAAIAAMKPGVLLVNTARGPLVVEEALAAALHSGQVGGAAVDVVAKEPIPADSPLLAAPNCFITPHVAWAAKETRARLLELVLHNLRAFVAGAPQNVVNGAGAKP